MATLLLTAVGTAVGGPIGGLIGAVAGRAFDTQVLGLGNTRVVGGRLENLDVQSGSYGGTIPLLFGTGRYAGNVIWSTGLMEMREEDSQGGKGGPSVTTVSYTYSASFAVGFCLGPIQSVGRVWADGKLIRSAGSELSVGGELRVYTGSEDQAPDPLIEGEIGLEDAPGFRGIAYAVFEALPLAEFGNRIPNLTFEVIAAADADVADIAAALVGRSAVAVTQSPDQIARIGGYQVSGTSSFRDGLGPLTDLFPIKLVAGEGGIQLRSTQQTAQLTLGQDMLGARPITQAPQARIAVEFDHALDLPGEVEISFNDPSTDYQDGVQRAQKVRDAGDGSLKVNTAMTLSASMARALAVQTLARVWDERLVVTLDVGLQGSALEPGDLIEVEASPAIFDVFEITQITHDAMITSVTARSLARDTVLGAVGLAGYSGEISYQQDVSAPTIQSSTFELPATQQFGDQPTLYAAVSRTGGRLNSAGLYTSRDDGVTYQLAGQVPVAAVTGTCVNGLEDRNPALFDHASALEVQLDHGDMGLSSRPELAILNGANLARVGTELFQFLTAELLENGNYRLSGLLRGRGGTEQSLMGLSGGQAFTLLQNGDLASQLLSVNDLGTSALFKIVPSGQALADTAPQTAVFTGAALKPFSPVCLTAIHDAVSGLSTTWIRRSRTGFAWTDGADAPIGEASLAFRVTYTSGATSLVRTSTSEADALNVAEMSAAFGSPPYALTLCVAQISDTVGAGNAAQTTLMIS